MRCHLRAGRWREKVNLSVEIVWVKSDITNFLEGEGVRWICQHRSHGENQMSLTLWKVKQKGQFLSTDHMGIIGHHLQAGRWREKWIRQCRLHGENQESLTSWKVKGKGEFVSTCCMGRIRRHWQTGRWRGKVNSSAQRAWRESDVTYWLEGKGKRWIHQHRSHGENQTSLTS